MPYLDKDKERAAKRKWWRKNRGKGTRTLEPTLEPKPLEPIPISVLVDNLAKPKMRDVFIGGRRFSVPE